MARKSLERFEEQIHQVMQDGLIQELELECKHDVIAKKTIWILLLTSDRLG
jgi:hypothetical protein